jgi:hypothetical protein
MALEWKSLVYFCHLVHFSPYGATLMQAKLLFC